ncbi:DeoR/GlpR transcriptional regulator [Brevibacillus sp. SYP-B805]|uniref:DeoR/GlpR family DNA-binding transcription regulator n=1 Tax=Brevibacillus sp. SYP-B805 TaxID=1578199 RepID=UPI0013EBEDB6|nr:DeoR/GlpR family DNA-binding transcription regulator [Brevibacillus sp. SYP-B805]NGQ96721.1 DeoR/GlpR transcriptional regulator [Brevibacillus sp. SYP-B805]
MLVAERHEKIVRLVNERGSIRVSELSEICNVTEETIRRDLDRLEQAGRLLRSHGGAVSILDQQPEVPYMEREITHMEEKKRIAQEAVKLIEAYDRIILDASTTAWYMASILPDIPLTVVTNSIKVAMELSGKEKVEVISTGGVLAPRSLSFVGPSAERSLDPYHVGKAFLSCKGIHLDRGISESNEMQALVKRKMIAIADRTYLLADYSKFGLQAFTYFAELHQIDEIITDDKIDPLHLQELKEKAVKVTVAGRA